MRPPSTCETLVITKTSTQIESHSFSSGAYCKSLYGMLNYLILFYSPLTGKCSHLCPHALRAFIFFADGIFLTPLWTFPLSELLTSKFKPKYRQVKYHVPCDIQDASVALIPCCCSKPGRQDVLYIAAWVEQSSLVVEETTFLCLPPGGYSSLSGNQLETHSGILFWNTCKWSRFGWQHLPTHPHSLLGAHVQ